MDLTPIHKVRRYRGRLLLRRLVRAGHAPTRRRLELHATALFAPRLTRGKILAVVDAAERLLRGESEPRVIVVQPRYRRFWEKRLGRETILQDVNLAMVSRIVAQEAERCGWLDKTRNHCLNAAVEAWNYAETYLKWISPQENLEAVRRHKVHVDNMELAYSEAEAVAILTEAPEVDLRCAVAGELTFVGGRRINAIRVLQASA